jgi:hypothetical protein
MTTDRPHQPSSVVRSYSATAPRAAHEYFQVYHG